MRDLGQRVRKVTTPFRKPPSISQPWSMWLWYWAIAFGKLSRFEICTYGKKKYFVLLCALSLSLCDICLYKCVHIAHGCAWYAEGSVLGVFWDCSPPYFFSFWHRVSRCIWSSPILLVWLINQWVPVICLSLLPNITTGVVYKPWCLGLYHWQFSDLNHLPSAWWMNFKCSPYAKEDRKKKTKSKLESQSPEGKQN